MLSKLEKLMYSIGVVDKVTGPVNKIMGKMQQLSSQTASAQDQMMRGMMGAAGGAMMLVGSLNPAIAANEALGEVSSLGVAESSLQQLNQTSLNFAAQYGGNAADVISSSYDIQSSISGLTGEELSAFTRASAIMAKGTKSDASTATDYMGTMYGIYQNSAKDMGKNAWVEQLAGQTATAVRMFKTNGSEMASAFSNLGAGAQSHGIEMAESMAVLGQLQATMSGSEAATKYKAFLSGVGKAQQALGVQLTDTQGKLLPMADVLQVIQGKFGAIDTVAKSDALKKAFGSEEAVGLIKSLLPQVDQLTGNIAELNKQSGMQTAIDMANAQTSAWQRLSGGFNAAATALGQAVLPIIEPVVEMLASMLGGVLWLTQEFPMLTGVVAAAAVGITALMVAVSAVNLVMGIYRFALISVGAATSAMTIITKVWPASLFALRVVGFLGLIATTGAYLAMMAIYKGAMLAAEGATWLFNAALTANPIGLVIAGVVGLISGIAALVYYWDEIVSAFQDTAWGKALGGVFDWISEKFSLFIDGVTWVLEALGLMDGKKVELETSVKQPAAIEALNADITTGIPANVYTPNASPIDAANLVTFNDGAAQQPSVLNIVSSSEKIEQHKKINQALAISNVGLPANVYTPNAAQIGAANLVAFNDMSAQQSSVLNIAQNTAQNTAQSSEKIEQYKQSNQALATTNTQRVSKTNYFAQNNNSSNSNSSASTDNSKRVYIDNLTMKSDNISDDFEQLMELAG